MMSSEDLWKMPIILQGKVVCLEPMSLTHIPELKIAGLDKSIWKYMLCGDLSDGESMAAWVNDMVIQCSAGSDFPFVIVKGSSSRVIGSTRFLELRPQHLSLSIGGTWISPEYQHTVVNTECKYLMLKYAFEELKCIRVQIKTDVRNEPSIHAIEKLGAVREGILRNHFILQDGTYRDSLIFSILDKEWLEVKNRLEERIERSISR
jgi:RimJ/RimL family protein N-acetyltransferase